MTESTSVYRLTFNAIFAYSILLLILVLTISACNEAEGNVDSHAKNNAATLTPISTDIQLTMSDPSLWTIDTVHLGTKQLNIAYDKSDDAVVITPSWSTQDIHSTEIGIGNVEHSRLHIYQLIDLCDCSQADSYFEILIPQAYVDEGKVEFQFSLQAGAIGDYLFNGRSFTMAEFASSGGEYTKLLVKASDFNEPAQKQRAIERINFLFHRNGSMVSAPIKIRKFIIDRNIEKIVPPVAIAKIKNPKNFYQFNYNNTSTIENFSVNISAENMDITKRLNSDKNAMELIPQWKNDQVPTGHSGKVTMVQPLGAIHDLAVFEVQYAINIPKAYFDEGKMDVYLFVQAGEAGYGRWSGTQRSLVSMANNAGKDMILTMTEKDLEHGKQRNQIEYIGLQLNRHGSTITEAITLKSITVNLPE